MKTLIIALVFGIGVSGFAQVSTSQTNTNRNRMEKMTPEQRQQKHLAKLTKELNLDNKQQDAVSKILADKNVKAQDLKAQKETRKANGTKMSPEERTAFRNNMIAEKANNENQIKGILTADQYAKWQAMRADNKEKMKHKRKEKM